MGGTQQCYSYFEILLGERSSWRNFGIFSPSRSNTFGISKFFGHEMVPVAFSGNWHRNARCGSSAHNPDSPASLQFVYHNHPWTGNCGWIPAIWHIYLSLLSWSGCFTCAGGSMPRASFLALASAQPGRWWPFCSVPNLERNSALLLELPLLSHTLLGWRFGWPLL